ncbi:MAG: hypothetical protein ACLRY4_00005, partial [Blautia sp.]
RSKNYPEGALSEREPKAKREVSGKAVLAREGARTTPREHLASASRRRSSHEKIEKGGNLK